MSTPPSIAAPPPPASRTNVLVAAVLIIVAALLAYQGSFSVPFLYDDRPAIVENPTIRQLSSLGAVLSPPAEGGLTVSGRPLLNLSLALNYALSGTAPWSYHALNLLLHTLNALLLFGILRRRWPLPGAFATALLWAVHPLSTQAVTYIVQRAELLMALCYLLTLYTFIRALDSPRPRRWLVLSVVACLLGMTAKEVMVSAPLIVLLYDRTFAAGTFRAALRQRGFYYGVLAATWLVLAALVASTGGDRGGSLGFSGPATAWGYAATECGVLVRYLGLVFWPHPLVFEYETVWARTALAIVPFALVVLALLGATIAGLRRRSAAGFTGACAFAVLAPTSSFVPMQTMAEYRMYLPLAAVLALVVGAVQAWTPRLLLPLTIVGALGLGALTLQRNADYRSELVLWADTAAKRPASARAHCNYGIALTSAGQFDDAIGELRAATHLQPNFAAARGALGFALLRTGRTREAVDELSAAVQLKPHDARAQNNLGNALLQLGRPTDALAHYTLAAQADPGFAEAFFNQGNALLQLDRVADAIAPYEQALRLAPDDVETLNNLGSALYRTGRIADALSKFERVVQLRPNDAEGYNNLGVVFARLGRFDEARARYEQALRLRPDFANARTNLSQLPR